MTNMQQDKQSPINDSLRMAAVDACQLLRLWSDSDQKIDCWRISEFQKHLTQRFAEIYFGTHSRLNEEDTGSTIESNGLSDYRGTVCVICDKVITDDDLQQIHCSGHENGKMIIAHWRCHNQGKTKLKVD